MHSSRMRTARLLPVSPSMHCAGSVCSGGSAPRGGDGGVCSQGLEVSAPGGGGSCPGDCCDMGQNDTIGKIELNPSFVLSSDNTNYKNDIQ